MKTTTVSLVMGLVFVALGLIPLLFTYGVISFSLPEIPVVVYNILYLIGGVLLLIDWLLHRNSLKRPLIR